MGGRGPRIKSPEKARQPARQPARRLGRPRADTAMAAPEEEPAPVAHVQAPLAPGDVRGILVETRPGPGGGQQTMISLVGEEIKDFYEIVCCLWCHRDDPPWAKISKSKVMLWARLSLVVVFIVYQVYLMIRGEINLGNGLFAIVSAIFLFVTSSPLTSLVNRHAYRRIS